MATANSPQRHHHVWAYWNSPHMSGRELMIARSSSLMSPVCDSLSGGRNVDAPIDARQSGAERRARYRHD